MRTKLMAKNNKVLDDFYVDSFSRFVSRFNCAAHQIKSKGLNVNYVIDHNIFMRSQRVIHKDKKVKVYGTQYKQGHWYISHERQYAYIHPFCIMLEGTYTRTNDPSYDIELAYNFMVDTIQSGFNYGFIPGDGHRDCWSDSHWSMSAAFHVGRYMLDKHCGMALKYKIPTILRGIMT
jgi:hypothetical protein